MPNNNERVVGLVKEENELKPSNAKLRSSGGLFYA